MKKTIIYVIATILICIACWLGYQAFQAKNITQNEAGEWVNGNGYITDETGEILSVPANSSISR